MDYYKSTAINEIFNKGLALTQIGVNNWGLTKKQALEAIDKLARRSVPILGGDVYVLSGNKIEHTYDSWCYEPLDFESQDKLVKDSVEKARTYINNYDVSKKKILFTLVPKNT